jgi:hypothetical protein
MICGSNGGWSWGGCACRPCYLSYTTCWARLLSRHWIVCSATGCMMHASLSGAAPPTPANLIDRLLHLPPRSSSCAKVSTPTCSDKTWQVALGAQLVLCGWGAAAVARCWLGDPAQETLHWSVHLRSQVLWCTLYLCEAAGVQGTWGHVGVAVRCLCAEVLCQGLSHHVVSNPNRSAHDVGLHLGAGCTAATQ